MPSSQGSSSGTLQGTRSNRQNGDDCVTSCNGFPAAKPGTMNGGGHCAHLTLPTSASWIDWPPNIDGSEPTADQWREHWRGALKRRRAPTSRYSSTIPARRPVAHCSKRVQPRRIRCPVARSSVASITHRPKTKSGARCVAGFRRA